MVFILFLLKKQKAPPVSLGGNSSDSTFSPEMIQGLFLVGKLRQIVKPQVIVFDANLEAAGS